MLLVVAVMVFHQALDIGVRRALVFENSKQVVRATNQMHSTRGLGILLVSLGPLFLLVDTVLLEVELVR